MTSLDQQIDLEGRVTTIRQEMLCPPAIPLRVLKSGVPPQCWAVLYRRANDCREFEISEADFAYLLKLGAQEGV